MNFFLLAINWSEVGIQVAQFFLALTLLITLHEFGHYITARWFKTRVEKFYLFFDFLFPFSNILPFSIFKKKVGETEYGLGWFPLGGYVKIAGMIDESMDKEAMQKPAEPWEFRSKKAWQRLIIMLGGIIVNVLLAFIIFYCLLMRYGLNKVENASIKDGVYVTDSIAYKIGIRTGDNIVSVDEKPIVYFEDVNKALLLGDKNITVNRKGQNITLPLPKNIIEQIVLAKSRKLLLELRDPYVVIDADPEKTTNAFAAGLKKNDSLVSINNTAMLYFDQLKDSLKTNIGDTITLGYVRNGTTLTTKVKVDKDATIGIKLKQFEVKDYEARGYFKVQKQTFTAVSGIGAAWDQMKEKTKDYLSQLKKFVTPGTGAYKGMGGFKGMAKAFGHEWDWHSFWRMTGILSLILAIMNLLPIPGLDGGYVLFTLIEMITGKKMNDKFMSIITTIGLVFLLALMLFANINDWFGWGK
jgi:regulator of sigma E protease